MFTKIIAEIGINHNGDLQMAKSMISLARIAGCNFAKIQKRNPDVCVPEDQKNKERMTPWGKMTYLEYKKRLEFDEEQIVELLEHSKKEGIVFFASVWDKDSVDLMAKYTKITKIPSALINDLDLCRYAREKFDFLIISTGMSSEQEVVDCVEACNPDVIMHTNSTYPCPMEDLNLRYIEHLKQKYPNIPIAAFQVSGEYAMIKAAADQGLLEKHEILMETLNSIKRAGADMILTYDALNTARLLS